MDSAIRVREVTPARRLSMLATSPLSMSRLSLIVDLASLLAREVDFDTLLSTACERLARALRADRATLWIVDAEHGDLVTRVAVLPELPEGLRQPLVRGIAGHVARTGDVVRVDDAAQDPRFDSSTDKVTGYTTRSMLVAPIREDAQAPVRGVVQLLNREGGAFDEEDEQYLVALATQLARALTLTTLRAADGGGPGLVLQSTFNKIVGRSALDPRRLRARPARRADRRDGAPPRRDRHGKGLFARAIHVNSRRQARPFITVDCTTLPAQLVESELFGHERGAFTGADRRVPGKVELAEGGTLFLDELGDLPPTSRANSFASCRSAPSSASAAGSRSAPTSASSAPPTETSSAPSPRAASAKTSTTAPASWRSGSPAARPRPRGDRVARPPFRRRLRQPLRPPHPRFEPAALAAIRAHAWPGNVRELEHWIESAIALAPDGRVTASHLPSRARSPPSRPRAATASPPPRCARSPPRPAPSPRPRCAPPSPTTIAARPWRSRWA